MKTRTRAMFYASLISFGLALVAYLAFVNFFFDYIESKAALLFIQNHRALGESDKFILDIAGQGLAQPWEIVVTWQPFQIGTLIALVLIALLGWMVIQTWRAQFSR